jgi:hypothetical protein
MLGTVAGNLAVTLGAQGGIYIGGGIVPSWERFDRSGFRARFEAKGRFNKYLAAVPTWVITAEYPAFVGVSAILSERLASRKLSYISMREMRVLRFIRYNSRCWMKRLASCPRFT